MSFSSDIKSFKRKAEKAATNIFRGTSLGLLGAVVKRTPVDTGRLRANWQVQINSAPEGVTSEQDQSGGKTISNGKSKMSSAKLGDSIFIINNLEYAPEVEDGSSRQAPFGMLKVTVAEFKQIVEENARKHGR